jgi:hypothetical protein
VHALWIDAACLELAEQHPLEYGLALTLFTYVAFAAVEVVDETGATAVTSDAVAIIALLKIRLVSTGGSAAIRGGDAIKILSFAFANGACFPGAAAAAAISVASCAGATADARAVRIALAIRCVVGTQSAVVALFRPTDEAVAAGGFQNAGRGTTIATALGAQFITDVSAFEGICAGRAILAMKAVVALFFVTNDGVSAIIRDATAAGRWTGVAVFDLAPEATAVDARGVAVVAFLIARHEAVAATDGTATAAFFAGVTVVDSTIAAAVAIAGQALAVADARAGGVGGTSDAIFTLFSIVALLGTLVHPITAQVAGDVG